jgi:hypothetical protein
VSDWIEHDGGPQPVADDVWVEVLVAKGPHFDVAVFSDGPASCEDWPNVSQHRILNQHLIDAARLEGIRLGLEAAAREASFRWLSGGVEVRGAIQRLDPATIAREAVLDKLVSEAQEQGMGYEKEADQ